MVHIQSLPTVILLMDTEPTSLTMQSYTDTNTHTYLWMAGLALFACLSI